MAQLLVAGSTTFNFGDVTVGTNADLVITIFGDSTEDVSVSSLSIPTFFTVTVDPTPCAVNDTLIQTITVRFSPSGTGVKNDTLVIYSDATNNPVVINLTGNGVTAGTVALSVNPASWTFPDTKVGVTSAQKVFTITNTGSVNVNVTALNFTPAAFTIGSTSPGLPATITPGNTLDFGGDFTPGSEGLAVGSVSVVSSAAASPFVVTLLGIGFLITPDFIVTSGVYQHLYAMANNLQAVTVDKLAVPLSYDTEESASLEKAVLLPFPTDQGAVPGFTYEKQVMRVFVHYEDWGVGQLVVTLIDTRGHQSSQEQNIGTVGATKKVGLAIFDIAVVDEIVRVRFTRSAGKGPLVLVDYTMKYEIKGEKAK